MRPSAIASVGASAPGGAGVSRGLGRRPTEATSAHLGADEIQRGRLGDFLLTHIGSIGACCDHAVRFGVVESVNATIKGVIRRARGMRDEAFLILKLKWVTARPIRNARDYARFIHPESLHSNR